MTTTEHDYIAKDLRSLAFPVANLKLLPGNPRRGDVDAVARSYERFGQRKPIVARRSDMTVIAGNHQLQAAQRLGWTHVAVVWTDDDDLTAKAYALADNRTSELGSNDEDALAEYLSSILDEFDDLAAIGYTEGEIADLLVSSGQAAAEARAFLGEFTGERASLHNLDTPEVDLESLTFLLPKQHKAEVMQRLRQYMQDHELTTTSDALYLLVTT